jgi:hypothetical protein
MNERSERSEGPEGMPKADRPKADRPKADRPKADRK